MGKAKTEIIYGFHSVNEALAVGWRGAESILVSRRAGSRRLKRLVAEAQAQGIAVESKSSQQLREITRSDRNQGIAARVTPFQYTGLEALVENAGKGTAFILVLDSVVDPHNLGALIRSAHCAGVDGVVVAKDRAAGASPAVSNISAGALEHMPVARVTNIVKSLQQLKNAGIWAYGLAPGAGQTIYETAWTGPVALVIGGEQHGIRPLVQKTCDFKVSIPLVGRIDSLNAAAAGAVAMYEVLRQRRTAE